MSKIPTKNDYLNQLRNDPSYKALIKRVESKDERRQIISRVEYFATTLFDSIMPGLAQLKQDPATTAKISEALKTGDNIIKESSGGPIASGSKG